MQREGFHEEARKDFSEKAACGGGVCGEQLELWLGLPTLRVFQAEHKSGTQARKLKARGRSPFGGNGFTEKQHCHSGANTDRLDL